MTDDDYSDLQIRLERGYMAVDRMSYEDACLAADAMVRKALNAVADHPEVRAIVAETYERCASFAEQYAEEIDEPSPVRGNECLHDQAEGARAVAKIIREHAKATA